MRDFFIFDCFDILFGLNMNIDWLNCFYCCWLIIRNLLIVLTSLLVFYYFDCFDSSFGVLLLWLFWQLVWCFVIHWLFWQIIWFEYVLIELFLLLLIDYSELIDCFDWFFSCSQMAHTRTNQRLYSLLHQHWSNFRNRISRIYPTGYSSEPRYTTWQ